MQLVAAVLLAGATGLCDAAPQKAGVDREYLSALQQRAAASGLAQNRAWHALLHYEPNWLTSGVASTVTTDWFFRASGGNTDPGAELSATLAAFFDTETMTPREAPPRCVYPARYRFLDQHLHFDAARMPAIECEDYRAWTVGLATESVSLVFPASYPNSPSSMFGHTLLRLNARDQKNRTELLAYAINFAANTDESNGAIFAVKGLAGGYPGVYGLFPYYEKVKQYAWIENRDVWDYRLHLSETEIEQLVAHLWELRGVAFDYYFLIKNCSYQLLALMQAARPELRLTDVFDWYAIPADTIRAVDDLPGLLGPPNYRPSLATVLAQHHQALAPTQRDLAQAIAAGRLAPDAAELKALAPQEQAQILEVAHDQLYYDYQTGAAARKTGVARSRDILLARSRIQAAADFPAVAAPDTPPEAGHRSLRSAVSGVLEGDQYSLGLRLRPAYHDLLDAPGGYTAGAQINFLDVALRVDPDAGDLEIDQFTLIDIVSIGTRNMLFQPISWQVSTGLRQRPVAAPFDADAHLGGYVEGGPGLAWGDLDGWTAYIFGLGAADINHGFAQGYALGAGASIGALAYPLPGWQLRAEVGGLDYALGDDGHRAWARLTQQWPLGQSLALRAEIAYQDNARRDYGQAVLSLQSYF